MMERVKKVDVTYLLIYLLAPILLIVVCYLPLILMDLKGAIAVVLVFAPVVIAIAIWILCGSFLYKRKKKEFAAALDEQGFIRNHTFNSDSCTVIVDAVNGKIALLFRWNMFHPYVLPASRIEKTWVDDGRGGAGFMEGSSRVSFLFLIDGIKIRVNTFTSNKRWRMDSDYILTGISKADMMVEVLNATRNQE